MSRNTVIAASLGALLSGAAIVVGFAPASFAASEAEPAIVQTPPSIRVTTAERREIVEKLTVTGTILPRDEAVAWSPGTDHADHGVVPPVRGWSTQDQAAARKALSDTGGVTGRAGGERPG